MNQVDSTLLYSLLMVVLLMFSLFLFFLLCVCVYFIQKSDNVESLFEGNGADLLKQFSPYRISSCSTLHCSTIFWHKRWIVSSVRNVSVCISTRQANVMLWWFGLDRFTNGRSSINFWCMVFTLILLL